MSDLIELTFY